MAGGVAAGASKPNQVPTSKPGKAVSDKDGTSGMADERLAVVTAKARSLPALTCGRPEVTVSNIN